jgi:hypothetical protein
MTKIFNIPCATYDTRIEMIKQFRSELGSLGNTWSFSTSAQGLELHIKYPDNCAYLSFLMLKYGDRIKVRTG